jgi:hypothetical protein
MARLLWHKEAVQNSHRNHLKASAARFLAKRSAAGLVSAPNLAGWNVAFKRLDTAKNVTVSSPRFLRRTITRCDAKA